LQKRCNSCGKVDRDFERCFDIQLAIPDGVNTVRA